MSYTVSFSRSGLNSEIFIGHSDPAVNTFRFDQVLASRDALEVAYGSELLFEHIDGRKGCRIAQTTPGSALERDSWELAAHWFVEAQQRLRKAIQTIGGVPNGFPVSVTASS